MNSATTSGDDSASGGGLSAVSDGTSTNPTSAASTGHRLSLAESAGNTATPVLPVNVMFFDGVCGLCNRFVDFVLSRDRRRIFLFAPLQGETARRCGVVDPRSSPTDTFNTFVWRDAHGRHFIRSAASVRVLWQIGGIWSVFAALLWLIPLPLRDLGYRLVAANRFRLFGRKESCRLPTPAERSRFLD